MTINRAHMSMSHRLRAAGLAAVLTVGFVACGSDSDTEPDTDTTDAPSTDAPAAPATDAPATEAPAPDVPATDATEEETPPEEGAEEAPAESAAPAVAIIDFQYDPNPVEVAVGTEIVWTNEDSFAHTVTNDGGDVEFDSGNLAEGDTYATSFDAAGEYAYICTIHNQMKATIVVS